jgi:hypothetical protein
MGGSHSDLERGCKIKVSGMHARLFVGLDHESNRFRPCHAYPAYWAFEVHALTRKQQLSHNSKVVNRG